MNPTNIPTLEVPQALITSERPEAGLLQGLAQSVGTALSTYPYYVVVSGYPAGEDRAHLVGLAEAIGAIAPKSANSGFIHASQRKVSFTKVRINPTKGTAGGNVTQYSRTHLPLPPHTDSSYMPRPHELVAFQCIIADGSGGASIMVPIEDLLKQLGPEVTEPLQAPVYPFGERLYPILFKESDEIKIRYYQAQIDRILKMGAAPLSDRHQAALKALDAVLEKPEQPHQFHLQAGQIVLMHNHKVLHGRTGFAQDSDRLLYRVRLHVNSFTPVSSSPAAVPIPNDSAALLAASQRPQPMAIALDSEEDPDSADGKYDVDATAEPIPELAAAHISLAKTLEKNRQFDDALEQYRQASELAPASLDILRSYGKLLLKTGKFAEATLVFQRCLAIAPHDYDSSLALSSLIRVSGDNETAHSILGSVIRKYPYAPVRSPSPQKPTLIRLRGLDGSAYGIVKKPDGTYRYLLQGGHFSIRDLVDKKRYNLVILNIIDDNVDDLTDSPNADILLNTIACPDLKRGSLLAAARFIDRYPHLPVINHPRQVLLTTRERNALRLNMIPGVSFPQTEKIRWDGVALDAIAREILSLGFTFPIIIRLVGSQTGSSVALIKDEAELRTHFQKSQANREYYVIQFRDCRNSQQIFNKTRIFFIDGNFYPVANLFHDAWSVHSGDRYSVMAQNPWMQEKEKSFLNDPINYLGLQAFDKLRQIRDVVNLDFFGIDFTLLEDGTLFIFELNAAMRHNFDHAGNFPYTKPHLQRISGAFETMLQSRLQLR
ncbi:MAG: TauD/TfdA family dioxygenase [Leptolyngbyaceae cyanobacterium]